MDVLQQFGELSEDIYEKRKYAKWRAAYIHNCLKNGEQPISGNAKIIYTKEEEENFKDFMSKEDYDRMKGEKADEPSSSGVSPPTSHPQTPSNIPTQPTPPVWPTPQQPSPQEAPVQPSFTPVPSSGSSLGPEQMEKAQKYCKWAQSALNYDDVNTAISNLQKALHLLQFGKEM